jgi:hypothetical protein
MRRAWLLLRMGLLGCYTLPAKDKFAFATPAEKAAGEALDADAAGENDTVSAEIDGVDAELDVADASGDAPDTSADVPDTSADVPDTSVDVPDTSVDAPDTSGDVPDTSVDVPDTSADVPDTSVDVPDTSVDAPDTSGDVPDTSADVPDTSVDVPDTSVDAPDTSGDVPDTSVDVPDTSGDVPDTSDDVPDTSVDVPDVSVDLCADVTCPDLPCKTNTCNPASGECDAVNLADGVTCEDGSQCTLADQCVGGSCASGGAANCDDGNACTDDTCAALNGCGHANNDANTCSDNSACTLSDACSEGTCVGLGDAPTEICNNLDDDCDGVTDEPGANGCTLWYVDNDADGYGVTESGVCLCASDVTHTASTPGDCDDGDAGRNPGLIDACNGVDDDCDGKTDNGVDLCNDGNACTKDTCATSCQHNNTTQACDDGNACTTGDVCSGGGCVPVGVVSCNDSNPCTNDVCDPKSGVCSHPLCSDGDVCTVDVCVTGSGCVSHSVGAQMAYLKANNPGMTDLFGTTVAIDGDTIVIGASQEDGGGTGANPIADEAALDSGAAYVFVRQNGAWALQAYLKASNTGAGDRFGSAVAISGDTIVVGAPQEDSNGPTQSNNSASNAGAAYVFFRSNGVWSQQGYLKASNPGSIDLFGSSVAISGDAIVVGSPQESSSGKGIGGDQTDNTASAAGAAYVYRRYGETWNQESYVKASNTAANFKFGTAVGISGDTLVIGSIGENSGATGVDGNQADTSQFQDGAAYVFTRNAGLWSQQAYLKASNVTTYDQFGGSVAISGNTIVIGCFGESSPSTGVNGDQSNTGSPNAGAAYVFRRTGSKWGQEAFLKASNTGAGDFFGSPVGIAGDTIVVAAYGEDGGSAGVNGVNSDGTSSAGAVYVFARQGTTWSQQAYLKASNPGASDYFGSYAAVSGDTVVASATMEDGANDGATDSGAAYVFEVNQGCDDHNACTLDSCGANACGHSAPLTCIGGATCDPASGCP